MKLDPFFFLFCNLNVMQNHSSFFSVTSAKLSAIQVQYNSIDHHDEFRKTFNFHVVLTRRILGLVGMDLIHIFMRFIQTINSIIILRH